MKLHSVLFETVINIPKFVKSYKNNVTIYLRLSWNLNETNPCLNKLSKRIFLKIGSDFASPGAGFVSSLLSCTIS